MSQMPEKMFISPECHLTTIPKYFAFDRKPTKAEYAPTDCLIEYIRADLVPKWRLIESAPKDGTIFLGITYADSLGEYLPPCVCRYENYADAGFYNIDTPGHLKQLLSYWMPL